MTLRAIDIDLHDAIAQQKERRVRDLIRDGADVNSFLHGFTPLFMCVYQSKTFKILLDAGANPLIKSAWGGSVLECTLYRTAFTAMSILLERFGVECDVNNNALDQASKLYYYHGCGRYNERKFYEKAITLLVAAGANVEDIYFADLENDAYRRTTFIVRTLAPFKLEKPSSAFEKATFHTCKFRMTEICLAMANLMLPALLITIILEEACSKNLRMFHSWSMAALVRKYKLYQSEV